jgi:hypothetical protein
VKKLLLLALLAGAITVHADDNTTTNALKNGDFSSGSSFWSGDGRAPDSNTGDFSQAAAAPGGLQVTLRHGDWSKMNQDFDGRGGDYSLVISYSTSPDLQFSTKAEDYVGIPDKVGYDAFPDFKKAQPGDWILVILDTGSNRYTYWNMTPKVGAGAQSVSLRVKIAAGDVSRKGFFLLFPPGQGAITLKSIVMTPGA